MFGINFYGLILSFSLLLAYFAFRKLALKSGISLAIGDKVFTGLAVWGFIGARLYHVLNEFSYYFADPKRIFFVWEGGLAIHGAIVAGIIYLIIFCGRNKLPFFRMADLVSPALMLGQAIGRWGNYFNQELFGKPTSLPWAVYISPLNRPEGYGLYSKFHPTFFYEFLWDLLAFVLLLKLFKKNKKDGRIFAVYFILYSVGRIFVEFLRIDDVPSVFGLRLPMVASFVILMAGVYFFAKKESKTYEK